MSPCWQCTHWSPRSTAPEMARLGFAQCAKRMPGHTTSAHAPGCDRFAPLSEASDLARRQWLARHGALPRKE